MKRCLFAVTALALMAVLTWVTFGRPEKEEPKPEPVPQKAPPFQMPRASKLIEGTKRRHTASKPVQKNRRRPSA